MFLKSFMFWSLNAMMCWKGLYGTLGETFFFLLLSLEGRSDGSNFCGFDGGFLLWGY